MTKQPKVTLIEWPRHPVETIFALWQASRTRDPLLDPAEVAKWDPEKRAANQVDSIFQNVVTAGIPVSENLFFVFMLENVSIEWREQAVRHRVGHKFGDRLGIDLIPDLQNSTYWSQTMRILDMGQFFANGEYRLPETVAKNPAAQAVYENSLRRAESAYNAMLEQGIPAEDARAVLPLAVQHRISWGINFAALQHVVGKRSCWIAQLGIWEPIVRGMLDELTQKVHPAFGVLRDPPCFDKGKWVGCKYKIENEVRFSGKDPIPPCSLWHDKEALIATPRRWMERPGAHTEFEQMAKKYGDLWKRNPYTGEPNASCPTPTLP